MAQLGRQQTVLNILQNLRDPDEEKAL